MIASPTPNNPWESGTFSYTANRFTSYADLAANSTDTWFIDHGQYTANAYETLSSDTVNAYFPNDHTHTSSEGAEVVAKAFVRGMVCGTSPLNQYVVNETSSIDGSCI